MVDYDWGAFSSKKVDWMKSVLILYYGWMFVIKTVIERWGEVLYGPGMDIIY